MQSMDPFEQALQEIYTFYSRQHMKRDIEFDQQAKALNIDKGELVIFCKDFGL